MISRPVTRRSTRCPGPASTVSCRPCAGLRRAAGTSRWRARIRTTGARPVPMEAERATPEGAPGVAGGRGGARGGRRYQRLLSAAGTGRIGQDHGTDLPLAGATGHGGGTRASAGDHLHAQGRCADARARAAGTAGGRRRARRTRTRGASCGRGLGTRSAARLATAGLARALADHDDRCVLSDAVRPIADWLAQWAASGGGCGRASVVRGGRRGGCSSMP